MISRFLFLLSVFCGISMAQQAQGYDTLLPNSNIIGQYQNLLNNKVDVQSNIQIKSLSRPNKEAIYDSIKQQWEQYFPMGEKEVTTLKTIAGRLSGEEKAPKKPTILYFFSFGMPPSSWNSFFKMADRIKDDFDAYGIVLGLSAKDENNETKRIVDFMERDINTTLQAEFKIKPHPFLFRALDVKKVPAYVLANCPTPFRYAQCDYIYRVDGDITLDKAFDVFSDENKALRPYYFKLIEAK